ncbi:MAG: hypothetical protein WAJ93_03740 [Candidatus Nitrosopolaris sp.]
MNKTITNIESTVSASVLLLVIVVLVSAKTPKLKSSIQKEVRSI